MRTQSKTKNAKEKLYAAQEGGDVLRVSLQTPANSQGRLPLVAAAQHSKRHSDPLLAKARTITENLCRHAPRDNDATWDNI